MRWVRLVVPAFQRRLARLAITLSFRDDMEGTKNASPRQWCLAETPFNAALNGGSRERGREMGRGALRTNYAE